MIRAEPRLWWYRGMRRLLFAFLDPVADLRRGCRVLDAGSGSGFNARALATRFRWLMFAADLAWPGVSALPAGERSPTVQADIKACPFMTEVFDGVISLDVLVHFAPGDELAPLLEFARLVRPGGFLMIRVAALDILRSRHSAFVCERQRFTRSRLVATVEAAGFHVTRCTYANALLLPVALFMFRIWEPLRRQAPKSGTGLLPGWLLNYLLEIPLRAEAFLVAHNFNFPVGQSLLLLAVREPRSGTRQVGGAES